MLLVVIFSKFVFFLELSEENILYLHDYQNLLCQIFVNQKKKNEIKEVVICYEVSSL